MIYTPAANRKEENIFVKFLKDQYNIFKSYAFLFRFHPSNNDSLASGSTDGLVNVFDLSQGKVGPFLR